MPGAGRRGGPRRRRPHGANWQVGCTTSEGRGERQTKGHRRANKRNCQAQKASPGILGGNPTNATAKTLKMPQNGRFFDTGTPKRRFMELQKTMDSISCERTSNAILWKRRIPQHQAPQGPLFGLSSGPKSTPVPTIFVISATGNPFSLHRDHSGGFFSLLAAWQNFVVRWPPRQF